MEKKKREKIEEEDKIRCTRCGSTQNYLRIKEGSRICRKCGKIDPIDK